MTSISSKHHYIPQYYIKGFLDNEHLFYKYDKIRDSFKTGKVGSKGVFFELHRNWIFRCIVRHDSATKYTTYSGAKSTSIPLERLPIIPLQSTPLC